MKIFTTSRIQQGKNKLLNISRLKINKYKIGFLTENNRVG